MPTLSKLQVGELTAEQQEVVERMELQRVHTRAQLMKRVRGCQSTSVVGGLLMGLACGLAIYGIVDPRALVFAIICVTALVGFHFVRLNRRLDALIEFLHGDDNANDLRSRENSAR